MVNIFKSKTAFAISLVLSVIASFMANTAMSSYFIHNATLPAELRK